MLHTIYLLCQALLLGSVKPYSNSSSGTVCQGEAMSNRACCCSINLVETLNQSDNDVSHFRQSELLANADSWASIEWQEVPARSSLLPALRNKIVGIHAPEIFPPMHDMYLFVLLIRWLWQTTMTAGSYLQNTERLVPS